MCHTSEEGAWKEDSTRLLTLFGSWITRMARRRTHSESPMASTLPVSAARVRQVRPLSLTTYPSRLTRSVRAHTHCDAHIRCDARRTGNPSRHKPSHMLARRRRRADSASCDPVRTGMPRNLMQLKRGDCDRLLTGSASAVGSSSALPSEPAVAATSRRAAVRPRRHALAPVYAVERPPSSTLLPNDAAPLLLRRNCHTAKQRWCLRPLQRDHPGGVVRSSKQRRCLARATAALGVALVERLHRREEEHFSDRV
jgi:hypothetical protein